MGLDSIYLDLLIRLEVHIFTTKCKQSYVKYVFHTFTCF